MAIILPMTATKMIYPKMILCCNGIRFFSIRITSYPLKKQILTTADLASSTCNKTQQYLSILLIPTERRAYNMMCTPKFGLINNSDSMSSVLYRAHVV